MKKACDVGASQAGVNLGKSSKTVYHTERGSAMNIAKKNRMEAAKLALAYMAGGEAPYQAARKCGFARVGIMEEAIREMEAAEAEAKEPVADEPVPVEGGAYLPGADVVVEYKAPLEPKVFYAPLQTWRNNACSVSHYGQNGNFSPMYKVMPANSTRYLNIPEADMQSVAMLLCEVCGLAVKEKDGLYAALTDANDTLEYESKQHLEELKRNEMLVVENETLRKTVVDAERRLVAEKQAHNDLKLKMCDLMLEWFAAKEALSND